MRFPYVAMARGLIDDDFKQELFQLEWHILWLVFQELVEGSLRQRSQVGVVVVVLRGVVWVDGTGMGP
jgi:hypothetical protein